MYDIGTKIILHYTLKYDKIITLKGSEHMNQIAIIWLIAAVIFGVVEIITAPLICIWFCGGALVAALIGGFTNSMWVSTVVFVVVSALLLAFTRPLVKSKIAPKVQPTNADRIIGKEAVVILGIDPVENVGQIKVDGQVWSAKSEYAIDEGEKVTVSSIEGVKAVVTK